MRFLLSRDKTVNPTPFGVESDSNMSTDGPVPGRKSERVQLFAVKLFVGQELTVEVTVIMRKESNLSDVCDWLE